MKDDVVIPQGLVRTWKAGFAVFFALGCGLFAGYQTGHHTARVETHIERVEVPYPDQCIDKMIRIEEASEKATIACSHPDHHGHFETVFVGGWAGNVPYLMCTCSKPQLDLPEAGAK